MATDWGKILVMKVVKIGVGIILALIILVVCVGLFTNNHIKIGFIEFNNPNEVKSKERDTITIVKHDTVNALKGRITQQKSLRATPSTNNQINDSGSSGIQNNAPNYGNQAGRDINNYGIIPRIITDEMFTEFYKIFPGKNTIIGFEFIGTPDAEMLNVKQQITDILRSRGYSNVTNKYATAISTERQIPDIYFSPQEDGSVYVVIPPPSLK